MYANISKPPTALPTPRPKNITTGVTLLPPLSRRGHGPGLIVLVPESNSILDIVEGVPSLLIKWAEEGYNVVAITPSAFESKSTNIKQLLRDIFSALAECEQCTSKGGTGLVAYDTELFKLIAPDLAEFTSIVAAVVYTDSNFAIEIDKLPILHHHVGQKPANKVKSSGGDVHYYYPKSASTLFAIPFQEHFDYNTEAVSHTRNLTFLKKLMDGPDFDLESIWDEHTYYEFADRSVEHTMSTMVAEPYVNHVPTLTGGIGRASLTDFYHRHFIFNNSSDTELELISRTVGIDRVVDEFIFKFTHDRELDWLFPGIPPTNRKVELPFVAIVNIRGDRLYHEHISWDQASALKQIGLLPDFLPFPEELLDGKEVFEEKSFQYQLPVAGVEAAEKMRDRKSLPSNQMFEYKVVER